MPAERCQRNNEQGWRWGGSGFCYLPSEEGSDENARQKALAQGRAIKARQHAEQQEELLATHYEIMEKIDELLKRFSKK